MAAAAIPLAQFGASLLGGLLGGGHDDDDVDFAEDDIARNFFIPIIQEMIPGFVPEPGRAGGPGFTWSGLRSSASNADLSGARISPSQARALIARGDAIISDSCARFARAGFPCPPDPPGKKSSGAGRDITPTWNVIRGQLELLAAQAESSLRLPQLKPVVFNSTGLASPDFSFLSEVNSRWAVWGIGILVVVGGGLWLATRR